jgi:hypothetical protein
MNQGVEFMQALKENLMTEAFWLRLCFMLLFVVVLEIATSIMGLLILMQFVYRLFSGRCQPNLLGFSDSLALFILQGYRFLTYQTETKPYPFDDWPQSKHQTTDEDC